jgi:hypothetical protein
MSLKDLHLNLKKMKNDLAAVGIVTGILIVFVTLIQFISDLANLSSWTISGYLDGLFCFNSRCRYPKHL